MEFSRSPLGWFSPLHAETTAICAELTCFVTFLGKHGHLARAYRPSSVARFDSLPPQQRQTILAEFRNYAGLCASIESEGISFEDSPALASAIVNKIGLHGPRSFFENLGSDDLVEIYNSAGIQIFRNFVFYDFCTYSLLDLISYPWFELLERHSAVNEAIAEHIALVMGDCNDVVPSTIAPHNVRELFSEEQRMFVAQFGSFAPLFGGAGQKNGFICSGKLRFVTHNPEGVTFLSGRA